MNSSNKETLKWFGQTVCAAIVVFLIIITNVEIWNMASLGHTDGFHVWVSVLNMIWESALSFVFFRKKVFRKRGDTK